MMNPWGGGAGGGSNPWGGWLSGLAGMFNNARSSYGGGAAAPAWGGGGGASPLASNWLSQLGGLGQQSFGNSLNQQNFNNAFGQQGFNNALTNRNAAQGAAAQGFNNAFGQQTFNNALANNGASQAASPWSQMNIGAPASNPMATPNRSLAGSATGIGGQANAQLSRQAPAPAGNWFANLGSPTSMASQNAQLQSPAQAAPRSATGSAGSMAGGQMQRSSNPMATPNYAIPAAASSGGGGAGYLNSMKNTGLNATEQLRDLALPAQSWNPGTPSLDKAFGGSTSWRYL
jgi:hypothetical protein